MYYVMTNEAKWTIASEFQCLEKKNRMSTNRLPSRSSTKFNLLFFVLHTILSFIFLPYYYSADPNDCFRDPCWNNGRCIDGIDQFTCDCQSGFGGEYCQRSMFLVNVNLKLLSAYCRSKWSTVIKYHQKCILVFRFALNSYWRMP